MNLDSMEFMDGGISDNGISEYAGVGTHWIALYEKDIQITYSDSFGVEHVPKVKILLGIKS